MSLLQPHGKLRRFEGVNKQPHLRQMSRELTVQHLECTLIMTIKDTRTIHVWYIYLHLVDFYGKCR